MEPQAPTRPAAVDVESAARAAVAEALALDPAEVATLCADRSLTAALHRRGLV